MNFSAFSEALAPLLKAHPCPHQDKRTEALFEFYGEKDFGRITEAAKLVAKEGERFPTPAAFEDFYRRTNATRGSRERELCDRCDGFGFVSLPNGTHRGRCDHGAKLSGAFLLAPESYRATRNLKRMTDERLAEDLGAFDPRRMYRGLLALGATDSPVPFLKRMHTMCLEMLGEERARAIRAEYGKAQLDLRILERKTPERMGRPGAKQDNEQAPKSHSETRSQEVNHE